jgi:hypothetical protein
MTETEGYEKAKGMQKIEGRGMEDMGLKTEGGGRRAAKGGVRKSEV